MTYRGFVTRSQWGARGYQRAPDIEPPHTRTGLEVHHNGDNLPMHSEPHSQCDNEVRGVQNWSMDGLGYSDFSYSFAACPHGYIFEGRGWDWDQFATGSCQYSSCPPQPFYSVLCLLGDPPEKPSQDMYDALDWLRAEISRKGGGSGLYKHSQTRQKTCPGPTLSAWVDAGGGGAPPTSPPPPPSSSTFTLDFSGSGSMSLRMVKRTSPLMSGTDVRSWQRLLADRGNSPGSIDGQYGDKSKSACVAFQSARGLGSDGIIGPKTGERLLEG